MKIRNKIAISLFSILILFCVITTATYLASQSVDYYRKRTLILERKLLAMTNLRAQVRNLLLETYEVGFIEPIQHHSQDLKKERILVEEKFKSFSEVMKDEDNSYIIEELRSEFKKLDKKLIEVSNLVKSGRLENAKSMLLSARQNDFNEGFIKKINIFMETQKLITQKSSQDLEASILRLQHILISFSAIALIMVSGLALFISRSIGERLSNLEEATKKVANGNYEINLNESGADEVSMLSKAFNLMAASLLESKYKLSKQQEIITHTSKMSALGEMAGGIAHEINTPLAAIILNAEMIEMQNADLSIPTPEISEHSQNIVEIGERIAKIIAGLKSFSRDASDDEMEIFTIRDLFDMTINLCNEKFKNHAIEIKIHQDYLDKNIKGKIVQLSQTLLNLLNNSYDAIENLDERWIELRIESLEKTIQLKVTDSGSGLSPTVVEKIFNPFFTTKEIGKGTGIGLSISKNIIKQHNGDLFYDKNEAHTTFVIELPQANNEINQ